MFYIPKLILFTSIIGWNSVVHAEDKPIEERINKIVEDGNKSALDTFALVCQNAPEHIAGCYQINTEQCTAFTEVASSRCIENETDYAVRNGISYTTVLDASAPKLLKCFEVNFVNQIYDSGGEIAQACR